MRVACKGLTLGLLAYTFEVAVHRLPWRPREHVVAECVRAIPEWLHNKEPPVRRVGKQSASGTVRSRE